jgi:hypothetical protein
MSLLKFFTRAAVLNCCFFMLAGPAWAQVFPDFEIEGNAVDDSGEGLPDDWENVFLGNHLANKAIFIGENVEGDGVDVSYFTTGGSKDNQDISAWKITSNSTPDKNEMQNAYAAAYLCPTDRTDCTENDLLVYLGADRYATNGDAQMGFWILRDDVSADVGGTNRFLDQFGNPANHQHGDLLVQVDFTNGGVEFTIRVYYWDGVNGLTLIEEKVNPFCEIQALASEDACGDLPNMNVVAPWPYTNKEGTGTGAGGGVDVIPAGGMFEARINVTRIFALQDLEVGCFSTFIAETRSSQSPFAQLKDFALGSFDLCDITLDKTSDVTAVCNLGGTTDITYMYTVTNSGSIPLQATLEDDEGTPGTYIDVIATWETQGGGAADGDLAGLRFVDLAARASVSFDIVLPISGAVTNTAMATGSSGGTEVTANDTHAVSVVECSISVTKNADQSQVCEQNTGSVTYDYTVENTGDVALINVLVRDDNGTPGNTSDDFNIVAGGSLAVDEIVPFDDVIPPSPGGLSNSSAGDRITNTVVATGTPVGFPSESVTADASATVDIFSCMIEITKIPDVTNVCLQSAGVTYDYLVTNIGTADIDKLVVVDDNGGLAPPQTIAMTATSLLSGESATGSYSTDLFAHGSGKVHNIVTADATSLEGFVVDQADANADVMVYICDLTVDKTCDDAIGQNGSYGYEFTVSNPGTIGLTNVSVDDLKADVSTFIDLDPGQSQTFDGNYASGGVTPSMNTVSVSASVLGVSLADSDDAECVILTDPSIDVVKSCEEDGDGLLLVIDGINPITLQVSFSGTVTNDGDVDLVGVTLEDVPAASLSIEGGAHDPAGFDLAIGDTYSFTGTYVPVDSDGSQVDPSLAEFTDDITAEGNDAINGTPVSDTDDAVCELCICVDCADPT